MTTDGGPAFNIEHALNELCALHEVMGIMTVHNRGTEWYAARSDLIQQRIVGEFAMLQERAKV